MENTQTEATAGEILTHSILEMEIVGVDVFGRTERQYRHKFDGCFVRDLVDRLRIHFCFLYSRNY